jgi:hypothetical protein
VQPNNASFLLKPSLLTLAPLEVNGCIGPWRFKGCGAGWGGAGRGGAVRGRGGAGRCEPMPVPELLANAADAAPRAGGPQFNFGMGRLLKFQHTRADLSANQTNVTFRCSEYRMHVAHVHGQNGVGGPPPQSHPCKESRPASPGTLIRPMTSNHVATVQGVLWPSGQWRIVSGLACSLSRKMEI